MSDDNTNKQYTADSIEVLSGLDPVKKRPGMYTETTRPNHLAQEVIDNSVDEALAGHASKIEVVLHQDGSLSVTDDGRGMGAVAKLKEFWVGDVTMGHPHRDSESNKLVPVKERPETVLNGLVRSYEIQAAEARRIIEAKMQDNRPKSTPRLKDPLARPSPTMIA